MQIPNFSANPGNSNGIATTPVWYVKSHVAQDLENCSKQNTYFWYLSELGYSYETWQETKNCMLTKVNNVSDTEIKKNGTHKDYFVKLIKLFIVETPFL